MRNISCWAKNLVWYTLVEAKLEVILVRVRFVSQQGRRHPRFNSLILGFICRMSHRAIHNFHPYFKLDETACVWLRVRAWGNFVTPIIRWRSHILNIDRSGTYLSICALSDDSNYPTCRKTSWYLCFILLPNKNYLLAYITRPSLSFTWWLITTDGKISAQPQNNYACILWVKLLLFFWNRLGLVWLWCIYNWFMRLPAEIFQEIFTHYLLLSRIA